ncbi:TPA: molecular chaperone [Klebsiella aerogenes]
MKNNYLRTGYALVLAFATLSAQAGIIASATRVIFNEGDTEKTLMLLNANSYPIVAQTWVDKGDVNVSPELSRAPFVPLPSVFSLQPSSLQGLRIVFTGTTLPEDRESVFWLNLYEIPPSQPNTPPLTTRVTLAMNTQMKIFYRPKVLKGKEEQAAENIAFSLKKTPGGILLSCINHSPFYLSFAGLLLKSGHRKYPIRIENDMMTAPFSIRDYHLNEIPTPKISLPLSVEVSFINDQGQQVVRTYLVTES